MIGVLRVTDIDDVPASQCGVTFDSYIPFSMRSYAPPLGGGYLSLTSHNGDMLELIVQPRTQTLRGVTLVSVGHLETWPTLGEKQSAVGLPVLATTFDGYRVDRLAAPLKVAIDVPGIIVFWHDDLRDCELVEYARMRFIVKDGALAGVWCMNVTEQERASFFEAVEGQRATQ